MTWTNYSTTPPSSWSSEIGTFYNVTNEWADPSVPPTISTVYTYIEAGEAANTLRTSYNIPGFEDGYQPAGVANPISGSFGGGSTIAVRDTYIDSDSTAATSWTGDVPSYTEGDLLVAVVMTRTSGGTLTSPTGWTQQGPAYLSGIGFGTTTQDLKVFTKVATASEPVTVAWTQAISSRICGFLVSMVGNDFTMGTVAQSYGNDDNASITNAGANFYITAATWLYTLPTGLETYSQTGPGLIQITDSPSELARISGGYSAQNGLIESYHDGDNAENNPNHGMISIPFTASGGGGGGGSTRPATGMLYPRGQG